MPNAPRCPVRHNRFRLYRRQLIVGATAGAISSATGIRSALAQAKVATPNIIKADTLVMSINPTLPPLQFVDDKGQLQGMRVELGNAVAKWLGLTPEYVRIEFAAMVPGLAAKRWDMINTGIFWTEERSKLMYMVPYERAAISFLVSAGNPLKIAKWEDLSGRAVSVELGGIEERRTREVDEMLKKANLKGIDIRTFNNFANPSRRCAPARCRQPQPSTPQLCTGKAVVTSRAPSPVCFRRRRRLHLPTRSSRWRWSTRSTTCANRGPTTRCSTSTVFSSWKRRHSPSWDPAPPEQSSRTAAAPAVPEKLGAGSAA